MNTQYHPSQGNKQNPNQGGQVQDKKTDQTNNVTSGDVKTKSEKNKDTNLGEAPEVTDGPKEPVNPFKLVFSDNGNAPHNLNSDNL